MPRRGRRAESPYGALCAARRRFFHKLVLTPNGGRNGRSIVPADKRSELASTEHLFRAH